MNGKPVGWQHEPARHGLAARGIRTRVHLPPREEARFRYSFTGAYDVRKLRQVVEDSASLKPEYEGFTTPAGQARFLHDIFEEIEGKDLGLKVDLDLEMGGLSYVYISDPPSIVVEIHGEEWFDSKVDNVDPWDFTVMASALLHLALENSVRENLAKEYRESEDKEDRWRISRKDII